MDFFTDYLKYTKETEPPVTYHRWSAITAIGALLGRRIFLQHGHSRIFPNLYTMLIGSAGTRKSTTIKLAAKLISASGYDTFARDKSTKEKFLADLAGLDEEFQPGTKKVYDASTAQNLWGNTNTNLSDPKEVFIAADEWNEFATPGNTEFYTTLGNLWDWDNPDREFTSGVKSSKSPSIYQPTVSILGGNTQEGFATAFPPDIIGRGFFSRLLLIHGERSERKIAFPTPPKQEDTNEIVKQFAYLRTKNFGEAQMEPEAEAILKDIYEGWTEFDDVRFKSYSNRRFIQLLKLCLIHTATRGDCTITTNDVITANTVLSAAEINMPRALGEFGKNKDSDVAQKVMDILNVTRKPLNAMEIFKIGQLHTDLESPMKMENIIRGLRAAGRIQDVRYDGGMGMMPKRNVKAIMQYVDWKLLTTEEREGE